MEVDKDNNPGCGIVQYEHVTSKNGTTTTNNFCIGRLSKSQVTESKWVRLALVCTCSLWLMYMYMDGHCSCTLYIHVCMSRLENGQ